MASRLHEAVASCRVDRVKRLLERGVCINSRSRMGETILLQALRIPNADKRRRMFNFLLKHGAHGLDVDAATGRDILSWACVLICPQQVKQLLSTFHGELNLSHRDFTGCIALHHAVQSRDVEIVKMVASEMKRFGVSVDVTNDCGLTPYLLAQKLGLLDISEALWKEGGASRYQADSKTFHKGDFWYHCGKTERQRLIKRQMLNTLKRNGDMRQLSNPASSLDHFLPSLTPRSGTELYVLSNLVSKSQKLQEKRSHPGKSETSVVSLPQASPLSSLLDSYKDQLCPSYRSTATMDDTNESKLRFTSLQAFTKFVTTVKSKVFKGKPGHPFELDTLSPDGRKSSKGKLLRRKETALVDGHRKPHAMPSYS